jgi:hypothetical protein
VRSSGSIGPCGLWGHSDGRLGGGEGDGAFSGDQYNRDKQRFCN